jgi:hypothetical protein
MDQMLQLLAEDEDEQLSTWARRLLALAERRQQQPAGSGDGVDGRTVETPNAV